MLFKIYTFIYYTYATVHTYCAYTIPTLYTSIFNTLPYPTLYIPAKQLPSW